MRTNSPSKALCGAAFQHHRRAFHRQFLGDRTERFSKPNPRTNRLRAIARQAAMLLRSLVDPRLFRCRSGPRPPDFEISLSSPWPTRHWARSVRGRAFRLDIALRQLETKGFEVLVQAIASAHANSAQSRSQVTDAEARRRARHDGADPRRLRGEPCHADAGHWITPRCNASSTDMPVSCCRAGRRRTKVLCRGAAAAFRSSGRKIRAWTVFRRRDVGYRCDPQSAEDVAKGLAHLIANRPG